MSKIREDMNKHTSKIQKTAANVAEVKALAREATEVGQKTANTLKDIKNKGIPSSGNAALSYAAVAASNTVTSNARIKQTVQTISIQTQREITVTIREPLTIQGLRAITHVV